MLIQHTHISHKHSLFFLFLSLHLFTSLSLSLSHYLSLSLSSLSLFHFAFKSVSRSLFPNVSMTLCILNSQSSLPPSMNHFFFSSDPKVSQTRHKTNLTMRSRQMAQHQRANCRTRSQSYYKFCLQNDSIRLKFHDGALF